MNLTDPISVLLVDDHACVREGYRRILSNSECISIVAEAYDASAACVLYRQFEPDVVIMDLILPDISGLEATSRIIARYPDARILISSALEELCFVQQAFNAKACGYITKISAADELIKAVEKTFRGEHYIDAHIAPKLAYEKIAGNKSLLASLSVKEFEIFFLMVQGISTGDIASRMSLSYKTVANHSTRIKTKLNVKSLACLTRLAIREGVIKA